MVQARAWPVFVNKALLNTVMPIQFHVIMAAFVQPWVVVKETKCPTKPKVFAIWPFTQKVCQHCSRLWGIISGDLVKTWYFLVCENWKESPAHQSLGGCTKYGMCVPFPTPNWNKISTHYLQADGNGLSLWLLGKYSRETCPDGV